MPSRRRRGSSDGTTLAYVDRQQPNWSIGASRASATARGRLPVQATVDVRRRQFLYTADGRIIAARRLTSGGGGIDAGRFTAKVDAAAQHLHHRASRARTRRSAEAGRHREPVVSPDGGAIAFTAMGDLWLMPVGGRPVQVTNDPAVEIDPGVVAGQHAAGVRQRSRRPHGSLDARPAQQRSFSTDRTNAARSRDRRGPPTATTSPSSSITRR